MPPKTLQQSVDNFTKRAYFHTCWQATSTTLIWVFSRWYSICRMGKTRAQMCTMR